MYADDLEQLAAGLSLYDAFYRWARDASDETHGHDRPTSAPKKTAEHQAQQRSAPRKPDSAGPK